MVCVPGMPEGEVGKGRAFSSRVCGAWSEPMQVAVPSATARRSASRQRCTSIPGAARRHGDCASPDNPPP